MRKAWETYSYTYTDDSGSTGQKQRGATYHTFGNRFDELRDRINSAADPDSAWPPFNFATRGGILLAAGVVATVEETALSLRRNVFSRHRRNN